MPSTYAHRKFGADVLAQLPAGVRARIEPYRPLYDVGLHGPDLLFYYHALTSNPVNRLGNAMHEEPGETFFAPSRAQVRSSRKPEAALAYVLGFICHFALDSTCHPYIEQYIRDSGVSHCEIETEFDNRLMERDGLDPFRYFTASHILPDMDAAAVIAPFFKGITILETYDSMRGMIAIHRLLQATNPVKRKIVLIGMRAAGKYEGMHGLVANAKPNPACAESSRRLTELYAGAIPLAVRLITQYIDTLDTDGALDKAYQHTFGEN